MPEWKFVLDEQAFDFFRAARGAERQALIRAFAEVRTHPTAEGVWQSRVTWIAFRLPAVLHESERSPARHDLPGPTTSREAQR